jgi:hypothetical protein
MYTNKTVRYKNKGDTSGLISHGKVIVETSDSYIIVVNGVQTSFRKEQIEIVDVLLDNATEVGQNQTLINEQICL